MRPIVIGESEAIGNWTGGKTSPCTTKQADQSIVYTLEFHASVLTHAPQSSLRPLPDLSLYFQRFPDLQIIVESFLRFTTGTLDGDKAVFSFCQYLGYIDHKIDGSTNVSLEEYL